MDFGVNLLTRGITGNADGLLSMARQAEALGFGHVTVNDHIVVPNRIASRYPSFPAPSLSEGLADLSWFAEEVRPLIKP